MRNVMMMVMMVMLMVGCITTQQATVMTLDTTLVLNNFDDVKSGIKTMAETGKFTKKEKQTIKDAEEIFNKVYADLMDPAKPVTYLQLFEASEAIVSTYEAVKVTVTNHWDEFPAIDQMRMKDFDTRMGRIYVELMKARDSEDAKAVYDATGQYIELLSIIVKTGIAVM